MTFSNIQAAAARSMLRRSLDTVAEDTGININMISRFERGDGNLSVRNSEKLEAYYRHLGVEFLDYEGVRFRPYIETATFFGQQGVRTFFDDIYQEALQGCNFCIFNGAPSRLIRCAGEEWFKMHALRMAAIKDRARFQVIVRHGELNLAGGESVEHRWTRMPFDNVKYIYGGNVAYLALENEFKALVIRNADIAKTERALFQAVWDSSTEAIPSSARQSAAPRD